MNMGRAMFSACAPGGAFMLVVGLLLLLGLVLVVAALAKYLLQSGHRSELYDGRMHAQRPDGNDSGSPS